jgi:hypothetical protein
MGHLSVRPSEAKLLTGILLCALLVLEVTAAFTEVYAFGDNSVCATSSHLEWTTWNPPSSSSTTNSPNYCNSSERNN